MINDILIYCCNSIGMGFSPFNIAFILDISHLAIIIKSKTFSGFSQNIKKHLLNNSLNYFPPPQYIVPTIIKSPNYPITTSTNHRISQIIRIFATARKSAC